jgi:vancomycin resistance protein YoaR
MKSKHYFLLSLILVCLTLGVIALPLILSFHRTAPQTYLSGQNYSLLTRSQLVNRLETDFVLPPSLTLSLGDQNYQLELASISAQINKDKTATNILYNFLSHGIVDYLLYPYRPHHHQLVVSYDEVALDSYLDDLSESNTKPFVPASLELTENPSHQKTIVVENGQIGYKIDKTEFKNQLSSSLSQWQLSLPIPIPTQTIGYLPTADQVTQTRQKAESLIGASLSLTGGSYPVLIEDKTLISWLNFDGSYDYDLIHQYVSGISDSLNIIPKDAVFKFEDGRVLEFQPSVSGKVVKQEELIKQIISTIDQAPQNSNQLLVEIPFTVNEASITTASANNLGIKELLGRGVSTFKHSSTTRNFNVQKGASVVNRVLVAPGETFSFLKNLGEVSLEAGYKNAYIIRQGKTELDVGGGICQVSTTLFRAMLNAGLDITQRQNHAYRVSYYEEDMPPGYDATVFIPSPDLKFINDTGNYLLIQSYYDDKNKSLTYEIYGTSDGRQVEIANYRKWGAAPAPPTKYIDDPTLAPGQLVQMEHAVPGLKTAFDWTVTKDGQILHQKTFQSNYVPWAAVYRRGPQP